MEPEWITFVADDETPASLRRFDGRKIPLPRGAVVTHLPVGAIGWLGGLPGEWGPDDTWLLREPPPPQPRHDPIPTWAVDLDRKLDQLLAAVRAIGGTA